jgi:hypothetical protein
MQPSDPTEETHTTATNDGFIARWYRLSGSRDVQLLGRLHTDLCNVPLFLLLRLTLQIKLTKARPSFYLMNKSADTKTTFRFLDAYLLVRRVQPNPAILEAHEKALEKGSLARYNMTRVDLKTFTFSAVSKFRSIENAALGPLPKRLLFTMIKNTYFNGLMDTNTYKFRHYISEFTLYVNVRRMPSEGSSLDMDNEKTSVMGYRILFKGSDIHHSNTGLQITHDMYINGFFMLLFHETPDHGASEAHTSLTENGNIRIELQFSRHLPEAITFLLYLEYDKTVLINFSRKFTTDF